MPDKTWKELFPGSGGRAQLLEAFIELEKLLETGRHSALLHFLSQSRWWKALDLGGVPREVLVQIDQHSLQALSAMLRDPPDTESAATELSRIWEILI